MGDLILADFKSRTYHVPRHGTETLEQMAVAMAAQLTEMAGEEVVCEMIPYGGQGIDGMWPNFTAPPEDCA